MRKKATIILLVSSLAFLIAMILFFSSAGKSKPGMNNLVIGETEVELFKAYSKGDEMLNYLDLAAQYSFGKAQQQKGDVTANFKNEFAKYLPSFNTLFNVHPSLIINNYNFRWIGGYLVGVYNGKVTIENPKYGITYSFFPNFRVEEGVYFNQTSVQLFEIGGEKLIVQGNNSLLP